MTTTDEMVKRAELYRADILRLDEARSSTVYGALSFFAISDPAHVVLKQAQLIQTFIPEGGMGLMIRLTPKGRKAAAILKNDQNVRRGRTKASVNETPSPARANQPANEPGAPTIVPLGKEELTMTQDASGANPDCLLMVEALRKWQLIAARLNNEGDQVAGAEIDSALELTDRILAKLGDVS